MNIWVMGASGLLGSRLCPFLQGCGHRVTRQVFSQQVLLHGASNDAELVDDSVSMVVDLSEYSAVCRAFEHRVKQSSCPDVVINLAALTHVDRCEAQPDDAYRLNTRLVENVVRWLKVYSPATHFIQLSTDQVYDGDGQAVESDVCIRNVYALSKYAGELAAQQIDSTVLRTNFVGKSVHEKRETLSDWLVRSLGDQSPIVLFDDVWFAPMALSDLCDMIHLVVQKPCVGVFNLGVKYPITKADFAERLAVLLGFSLCRVTRQSVDDANFEAYRPNNMGMDVRAFERAFDVELPDASGMIAAVAGQYRNANR